MWLIFCGAYDNESGEMGVGGVRVAHHQEWNRGKFNFLQCFFFVGGGWDAFRCQEEAKGIKKRDKIFKTLQLKDITFIHKLCMRG